MSGKLLRRNGLYCIPKESKGIMGRAFSLLLGIVASHSSAV